MKLTVLVDNNTLIDRYFLGEPGLSFLIETAGIKLLFDLGYSDAFITNANRMGIDLLDVDAVVLSHSHLDHTWGLDPLLRLHTEALIEDRPRVEPELITHPTTFISRRLGDLPEIGSLISESELARFFRLRTSREPVHLTDRLVFLGEIQRTHPFEGTASIGVVGPDDRPDTIAEDSALAYRLPEGLVIITGCSHAGICNIIDQARRVCHEERVVDIIGGFHLLDPSPEQLAGTLAYLHDLNPGAVHACHCTDLASKIALSRVVNLQEVGVGLRLEY